jgi:hypothetical protein
VSTTSGYGLGHGRFVAPCRARRGPSSDPRRLPARAEPRRGARNSAALPFRPRSREQGRSWRRLRSCHPGRQTRRGGDPPADRRTLSRSRGDRRGVGRGQARRRIRLGAGSRRRDPRLHRRSAGLDHPHWAAVSGQARAGLNWPILPWRSFHRPCWRCATGSPRWRTGAENQSLRRSGSPPPTPPCSRTVSAKPGTTSAPLRVWPGLAATPTPTPWWPWARSTWWSRRG